MPNSDKINNLSDSSFQFLCYILVGSVKMISHLVYSAPKTSTYKATSLQRAKSHAQSALLLKLPQLVKEYPEFRPAEIRKFLPEGKIQRIQYSDLSDILNSLVRIGILEKLSEDEVDALIRKRGVQDYPGIQSFYRPTNFYDNIDEVLENKDAVEIIYFYLLNSGMLFKYRNYIENYIIQIIRNKNYQPDEAWSICKSIFPIPESKRQEFLGYYNEVLSIRNHKSLEEMALLRAKIKTEESTQDSYKDLFRIGGYYFMA